MPSSSPQPSKPFLIPWECLFESESSTIPPQKTTINQPKAQQTFAQVLSNVCDIPHSQLPKPILKGDKFSIAIPDEEYDLGLDSCKNILHARIIWPKGSTPLTVVALKEKLKPLWKDLRPWGVTSIGKGFYEFVFSAVEDARRVRSVGSWLLNPGLLKLFPWSKDFNPSLQSNTSAQIWLRIHGLSQEYWRKKILFAIASSVGTPICVDSVTSKPAIERTFGHFVRVLVDLDLSKELKHEVLVERRGFAFFVDFEYENLPEFCNNCRLIGHNVHSCRKLKQFGKEQTEQEPELNDKTKSKKPQVAQAQKQTWVHKQTNNVELEREVVSPSRNVELMEIQNIENDEGIRNNAMPILTPVVQNIDSRGVAQSTSQGDINFVPHSPPAAQSVANREIVQNELQREVNIESRGVDQSTLQDDINMAPISPLTAQIVTNREVLQNALQREIYVVDGDSDSSHDSQFVDATQVPEEEAQASSQVTPARVQRDMHFLHESWANLAEADEEQITKQQEHFTANLAAEDEIDRQIQHEIRSNIADSGFKLVTRKSHKKKAQQHSASQASKPYLTRSKVPNRTSQ